MGRALELARKRFGKLTVIKRVENNYEGRSMWLCKCDCGNEKVIRGDCLVKGQTKSCGCLLVESATTHGCTYTRLYERWMAIRERCRGNDAHHKKYYTDAGITMCEEWNDYTKFRDWSLANGYKDELQIDRIDNSKGYSPDNCRWVTKERNMRNRRNTVQITYRGKTKPLKDWCDELDVSYSLCRERYAYGLPVEDVFYKGNLRYKPGRKPMRREKK